MAKKTEIKEVAIVKELVFDFKETDIITIVAIGKSKHLVEGNEYEVSGNVAKILITKGIAKIK